MEACNNPECQNLIHPSCFKKVMSAVAENDWEVLLFCGKLCFKNNKKVLKGSSVKHKGRVRWQTDAPALKASQWQ